MIKLGIVQKLKIQRITKIGAFLNDEDLEDDDILLPLNQLDRSMSAGDEIEVFVYRDSDDRLIATCKPVMLTLGDTAVLSVVDVNQVGVFLDWGLEKNLFMPYKEIVGRVAKGSDVLVGLYIDSTDRLCASMNVYEALRSDSPYTINDHIHGTIYKLHQQYGAFVAVDNKYHGLVPLKELYGKYEEGMAIEGRVKRIRSDGKLELGLRRPAHEEMESDCQTILHALQEKNGRLFLHDKSDPTKIKNDLQMSKAAFKRAIGKLFKEGLIVIDEKGIVLTNQQE